MTRQAVALMIRTLCKRLVDLGADIPQIETLNDSQASMLVVLDAIVSRLEAQSAGK